MNKNRKKREFKINVYGIIVGTILVLYALSMVFSIGWGILTSLKYRTDFEGGNYLGFPNMQHWQNIANFIKTLEPGSELYLRYKNFTHIFGNFTNAFENIVVTNSEQYYYGFKLDKLGGGNPRGSFFQIITNTILYVVGSALCGTLAPCIAGYLCSKFKYKFSGFIYTFVIFVMATPIVGNTTAKLMLLKRLSLFDTIYGQWILHFNFVGSNFLIFFAYFRGITDTYGEAAQIDGASYFRVMWRIYVPLASKIFSTIFLLQFVALYNDYSTALYYLPTFPTLSFAIWKIQFQGKFNSKPELISAALLLSLPILILFLAFKNKLMGNISLGGVKE